jgi:hypothetical protein
MPSAEAETTGEEKYRLEVFCHLWSLDLPSGVEAPKGRSHGIVADSGVDLSRRQVRVAEQLLNCPNIRTPL